MDKSMMKKMHDMPMFPFMPLVPLIVMTTVVTLSLLNYCGIKRIEEQLKEIYPSNPS